MRYTVLEYSSICTKTPSIARRIQQVGSPAIASHVDDIITKEQFRYLDKYFQKLNPKTVVIENVYVDRDFLEDYAAYHVRNFQGHGKECIRLLFFTQSFTQEEFDHLLASGNLNGTGPEISAKELQEGYLGYIVIRPLPQTMIGKTVIKTYPMDGTSHKRFYPAIITCSSIGSNMTKCLRIISNTLS